ncbi:hypothetical protein [Sphingomonas jatrophae]|uniref:Uncharacterized protein n=1 Tax=Sphingomonas jatrophae TaxID=1166337 RepID=A0A1I6K5L0_9SPHN|nr:hypothetical protein [Sphingomonas jatrophae]SFR86424.1 hypothetical protein SAMN05192580_1345 [Sphingomonas jatrophae]
MAEFVQAAGKIVGGVASYEAGRYNNQVAKTEAIEAERDGVVEEARVREAARLAIGEQVAAQAGSGFQPGTGSALEALTQSQVNAVLDAMTLRRQAAAKARAARTQGKIAKASGENALVAGLLGAASSVAGSQSDWAAARAGSSAARSYGGSPAAAAPGPR